jgi:hypothetical protein
MSQRSGRKFRCRVEQDAAVADEIQLATLYFLESVDERRLAVKVRGVFAGLRFHLINPDRARDGPRVICEDGGYGVDSR